MNLSVMFGLVFFLLILSLLVWLRFYPKAGYKEITPHQLRAMLCKERDFFILDVREPWEYRNGFIYRSLNLPVRSVSAQMGELEKLKEERIVVVCKSGFRSRMVCGFLEKEGFSNILHLKGGIKGWLKMGLGLVKDNDVEEEMVHGA